MMHICTPYAMHMRTYVHICTHMYTHSHIHQPKSLHRTHETAIRRPSADHPPTTVNAARVQDKTF